MPNQPIGEPFPFPAGYETDLKKKLRAESIKDYVAIFRRRRDERPDRRFADADIERIMSLAEDLGRVDVTEIEYLRSLLRKHPDYFRSAGEDDQKARLEAFADTHEKRNRMREDPLLDDILKVVPLELFRQQPAAREFLDRAEALAAALGESDAFYERHGFYDNEQVSRVNEAASALGRIVEGFTLSDIDDPGRRARLIFLQDLRNHLLRVGGKTDHESRFRDGKWVNWNRDVEVFPSSYEKPRSFAELAALAEIPGPIRMVAGGHGFNIASSMGGVESEPLGMLVTLDEHRLDSGAQWERVPDAGTRYHVSAEESSRVVRVSAGMRLREFGEAMRAEGMALPVAGSTDAQSLGGLLATDLHSTGHTAGFLSQQVLEVKVLTGDGRVLTFTKDEALPRGTNGRWRYDSPRLGPGQKLRKLPVSGAIGTAGIVFEVVLKLDPAFNMEKRSLFVPREWAEEHIERLLDPEEADPLFRYDHVSFYYPGGGGKDMATVRMNAWKRTDRPVPRGADDVKAVRELFDHVGSAFLPEYLLELGARRVNAPGEPVGSGHDGWLAKLNQRPAEVLPANKAFARKLFFLHDELEVGIPLPVVSARADYGIFREAIADTQKVLADEEFPTIIEIRFTPDASEGALGPGSLGPACYIELATPLGRYSRARIAQVYDRVDRILRDKYRARPHLGKKTTASFEDMAALYGEDWEEFLEVRRDADPRDRFLPPRNGFLRRIFQPEGER